MNRSSNESFVTPALRVTTDTETGETVVTSPSAPDKEWRAPEAEIATLKARTDLEEMFKTGNLGSQPKWIKEWGAKEKGSDW